MFGNAWRRLNAMRWYGRGPLKIALLTLGVGLVLYPKPWLLVAELRHGADLNSVLDPDHPGLAPFEADVRARLGENADARAALAVVERVVCERVPYAFDWEVWGVVEYLPTVDEVLKAGREDCDGRGVVAASLLRRMGYEAWLVSDFLHLWVRTPQGDTMSPTGAEATIVVQDSGASFAIAPSLVSNAARGLSFGVSVFPLVRELIIVAMICVLAAQPRSSPRRRIVGCLCVLAALFAIRFSGQSAALEGDTKDVAITVGGSLLALTGWVVLLVRGAVPPRRCVAGRPESPAADAPVPD